MMKSIADYSGDWRDQCARSKYKGIARTDPQPVDPALARLRAAWAASDTKAAKSVTIVGDGAKTFVFKAKGVRRVETDVVDRDVYGRKRDSAPTDREDKSEDSYSPPEDETFIAVGEPLDLGKVHARCIQRRLTGAGVVYVWQTVPGGRFDRFQTIGLPKGSIKEAPKK